MNLIYFTGFDVVQIDTGVAYVWVSQCNNLPAVGWIGKDLLITGHCGVENRLTRTNTLSSN